MMKKIVGLIIVAAQLVQLSQARAQEIPPRPNVLLIISDDQGYSDFGFMNNEILRTPRLDELAITGALIPNYSTGAACSPGRSMLFTGRNHLLTGVWGVPLRQNLRTDETMMPAFFKAAGYETYYVGKNDCVAQIHTLPWFAGWNDAMIGGGYVHHDPVLSYKPEGEMPLSWKNQQYEGWTSEIWTDEAIRFIKEQKDTSWFMTLAYIIPHMPWEPVDERYAPYYREQGCSENIAGCFSHIEQMDACVGRLLDTLAASGQDQRTIVIFVSDNGQTGPEAGSADKEGYIQSEDWALRNVANLRGSKSLVWENGTRVPLIVRYPESITPGIREQFGAAEDILPTLLDYAGINEDIVPHKPFCGVSLRPALDDAEIEIEHPEMLRMTIWGDGMVEAPQGFVPDPASLRFEDHHMTLHGARYKLHARPGGIAELYDIVNDIEESTDISESYPDISSRMLEECRQRWEYAINEGGAFRMAPIVVGDPSTWKYKDGTFWGYAGKIQAASGNMFVGRGLKGFSMEGESASYDLVVAKSGVYSIRLKGTGLEKSAPLTIRVAGQLLTALSVSDDYMEFGNACLPKGEMPMTIVAGKPEGVTEAVSVERILFSLLQ